MEFSNVKMDSMAIRSYLLWHINDIYFFVFNKKKVDKIPITEDEIETGRRILPIYITLSMIFLVILLVRHGVKKGLIHI